MTSKLPGRGPDAAGGGTLEQFPVFPPREDMQNFYYLYRQALPSALERHFGASEGTAIVCEAPVAWSPSQRQGLRIPDLLVAFGVHSPNVIAQLGYSIQDQGKPPDLVLEVASHTTGRIDYTAKRNDYAAFGIPEYWRFDSSGGLYHDAPLAGDLLVDGEYQPISIVQGDENHFWGHSPLLNLTLCWEFGYLRWWNPATGQYLRTFDEEADGREQELLARLTAEAQRDQADAQREYAETQRDQAEAQREDAVAQRDQAEARVRELEEQLRRQQGR